MRVAFISRSTLYKVRGGDTIQIDQTAHYLRKLGVDVDVFVASAKIPYQRYDLLHFFNIIRPADHLAHISKTDRPYVVSPIYLDYSAFDRYGRMGLSKYFFWIAGKGHAEYFKNLIRFYKRQDQLLSREYLLGHKRAMKKVLANAKVILPNSASENERLRKDLKLSPDFLVIPNGIDPELFSHIPDVSRDQEKVLCVAQIYGMKNQHRLIEACKSLNLNLSVIGKAPPNHKEYFRHCRQIANNKVEFHDFIPQEELLKHYAGAGIHALPSWFETTGLSSLEAGAMGCKLLVGKGGDTNDYFGGYASFCEADSVESITEALKDCLNMKPEQGLRKHILDNFTWDITARETFKAYQQVLNFE